MPTAVKTATNGEISGFAVAVPQTGLHTTTQPHGLRCGSPVDGWARAAVLRQDGVPVGGCGPLIKIHHGVHETKTKILQLGETRLFEKRSRDEKAELTEHVGP